MANNVIPLPVTKTQYVETAVEQAEYYAIEKSSQATFFKVFTTSSFSTSSVSFNCNPPNQDTIISRKILFGMIFQITLNGTVPSGNLLDGWGLTFAPRCLGLSNSIKDVRMQINNCSFSIPLNDVLSALTRFGYDKYKKEISYSPCYLDQSQSYSELINTNKNPLGSGYNSSTDNDLPRGSFNGVQIVSNTPTQAVIVLKLVEPILLSPLHYFGEAEKGFIGVNQMDFTFTFDTNLVAKLLSQSPNDPATITSSSITIVNQPTLLFSYYQPMETAPTVRQISYSYIELNRYPTDYGLGAVAPGVTFTMSSNNIQLNSIPRRMYIYARANNNSYTINSTDTFLRNEAINVTFGNRSGLLASMNNYQIYEMSRKNGNDCAWNSWYGSYNTGNTRSYSGVGSVIAIETCQDLGLNDLQSSGSLENTQLQVNCTFTNIHPTASLNVTMYIIILSDGVVNILNGSITSQVGVISANEILNAPGHHVIQSTGEGGSFLTHLKSIFKAAPGMISKALPYIKGAVKGAELLGLGEGEGDMMGEGRHRRVGRPRKHKKGRGLIGGELVTRAELRNEMY